MLVELTACQSYCLAELGEQLAEDSVLVSVLVGNDDGAFGDND